MESARIFLFQDCHLRDFMQAAEPDKCDKRKTGTMSSKSIRQAFYGMFRRPETAPLDTLPGYYEKLIYLCLSSEHYSSCLVLSDSFEQDDYCNVRIE